jgi:hypothetical protein
MQARESAEGGLTGVVEDRDAKERSQKERENELSSSYKSSYPEGRLPPFVTVCIQLQIITNNLTY